MSYECAACAKAGTLDPEDALVSDLIILAELDNGQLMCLPCYAESESICLHCGSNDGIYPDISCKAEPWLCRNCLGLPYRIHMFSCYGNGCMTPGEYAQESFREAQEDQRAERDKHGDHPKRSFKDQ